MVNVLTGKLGNKGRLTDLTKEFKIICILLSEMGVTCSKLAETAETKAVALGSNDICPKRA